MIKRSLVHPVAHCRGSSVPIDPRAAVLIGVGVAHGAGDEEAYQLMARATTTAAEDAGVPGMLSAVEHISVPRGTWSYPDPGRLVAGEIGATHARTAVYELGIPQQTLVSTALTRIRRHASPISAMSSVRIADATADAARAPATRAGAAANTHAMPATAKVTPVPWKP